MQNQQSIDYRSSTEGTLVALARQGDNTAFEVLIERNRNACQNLALSILRDRQDAEDEVQNACWKAFEHIGQFQSDSKFSTWLTRILVNQCLMRLRQTRRSRVVYLEDSATDDSRVFDLPASMDSPEQALARAEVSEVLQNEISRIPPLLRTVFELRDVQQLPMQDVADRLGISIAAAKSRLLRARLELRNRLGKHQGRLGPATLMA